VIAARVSVLLAVVLAVVVGWYLFVVAGRADDVRLTPLGQRVEFVVTRPLVIAMLLVTSAWFGFKTLFVDPGSLLGRAGSAALGMGLALLLLESTQRVGWVLTLAGLAAGLVGLVLAARRDPGLLTRRRSE
jgi:hypothetical protein